EVLKDPALLSRLVGQALQVQVLAPPAEPLRQSQPRPVLYTGFATLVGLMAGVFAAFLRDAARTGA
ncbi:MAG: lipopolysaccharide biosynthesis protein, partial [Thermoanaerobaculia bacterium]|nr:lipopolysaccharide biosynthesis protein [Thermoanaerobaculia bacterium]